MRRLTILIATVGALLLVPAAQAFAFNLHVNINGSGSGTVEGFAESDEGEFEVICSGPPSAGECDVPFNEIVYAALAAPTPDPGSEFLGWTAVPEGGGWYTAECPILENDCNLSLFSEPVSGTVTATFCLEGQTEEECLAPPPTGPPLTLNYEEGEGTVVSSPAGLECSKAAPGSCTTEALEAGKVVLTASPAPGYLFKGWKGCDTGGAIGRQCTVTLAEPGKTVGVKFVKAFSLDASKSDPNGILSTSPGGVNCGFGCNSSSALYKEGSVTVKTKPAKHYHFVEFQGGTGSATSCNGSEAETCTFTLSSNSAIEEVYAEDAKNTLTLSKTGGGQGLIKTKPTSINCGFTCTAAEGEYFFNEEAAVTVTLNKGTTSVTWTTGAGTCTGNAVTCAVPMSANHTLVAKFE